MSSPRPAVHLQADLDVTVDGVAVHITSAGSVLAVHLPQPGAALRAAYRTGADRHAVVATLGRLTAAGTQVRLTTPRGVLAVAGAGVHSRLGRLLTGSDTIAVGDPVAVVGLAGQSATAAARAHPVATGGCAGLVGLLLVGRGFRRRRTPRRPSPGRGAPAPRPR